MKASVYIIAVCAALVAVYAAPAPNPEPNPEPNPAPNPDPAADPADDRPEIIEIIAPAETAQETLASLNLGAPGSELSERNKRTIGILRQLFPTLTQIIEQKVQQITGMVLQTFGPVVLRAFLGGNKNGGGNNGGGGGSIELDDDDDDDDEDVTPMSSSSTTEATTTTKAAVRRKRALFFLPNAIADENQLLSGAESQQAEVRVAFGEGQEGQDQQVAASEDQQTAAQTNSASIDEITLDDSDSSDENRNKRFLNGQNTPNSGGSGNFLFDIVRRPAEAMARAAGTAFRLFAGTDSLNVGLTASHTATLDPNNPQLVSGTSAASSADPGVPADGEDLSSGKGDNLTEGVPGPITRLFIIANRGIANLIQDLILRIAQTSERIVNFKARLITSII
ncbi:uncharacterized protein ACR2FA_009559 isoform 2-T2 [Aphomia sociella]